MRRPKGTIDVRCWDCGASGVFRGIDEVSVPGKGVICWTCRGKGYVNLVYRSDSDHDCFIELKILEGIERVYLSHYGNDRDPFVTYLEFLKGKRPRLPKAENQQGST